MDVQGSLPVAPDLPDPVPPGVRSPRGGRPSLRGRLPAAVIGVATTVTVLDSLRWLRVTHPDWLIARAAGRTLLSGRGLHVYALHPRAQMGPLALVLAQLPRPVYVVLVAAALAPCLSWLAGAAVGVRAAWTPGRLVILAAGAALCVVPWSQLAWKGHADDALVLLGAALMLRSTATGGRAGLFGGLAVAMAGKPTALALVPLTFTSVTSVLVGAAVVGVIWLPFLLAGPTALLSAGRGVMTVGHGSLPWYLGVGLHAAPPAWIRVGQLVAGVGGTALGVLRARAPEGLLLGLAVRAALDPNPAPAYAIPLVVLAVAVDLRQARPVTLPLAGLSFWLAQPVLNGGTGLFRLAALGALTVMSLVLLVRGRAAELAAAEGDG